MSDNATLRRLLREHAEAVSTEIAIIKEDAILRLFDAVQNEYAAQVAALQAALDAAINMNIEKNAEVVRLTIALAAANEDAERMASESAFYEEGTGWRCIHCGENTKRNGYAVKHAADCPITLHRARAGGAS